MRSVYAACYRDEGLAMLNRTTVEAWIMKHTFAVGTVQRYREDIVKMLLCLPTGFRSDEGEGGSVAMASVRADQLFWTGDMTDVEKLIALGVASGLVSFCAPREKWHRLPGGLPYIRIEITRFGVSVN